MTRLIGLAVAAAIALTAGHVLAQTLDAGLPDAGLVVDAGAVTKPAAVDPIPNVELPVTSIDQAKGLGFQSYELVEKGNFWPILIALPFLLMLGLRAAWRKYPGKVTALLAHSVAGPIVAGLMAMISLYAHALGSGHAPDKELAMKGVVIFAGFIWTWVQRQSAPTQSPSTTAPSPFTPGGTPPANS